MTLKLKMKQKLKIFKGLEAASTALVRQSVEYVLGIGTDSTFSLAVELQVFFFMEVLNCPGSQ